MNIFELNSKVSAIAGLIAGFKSARGHRPVTGALGTVGGLIIGAACCFVPILAAYFISARRKSPDTQDRSTFLQRAAEASVVLLVILSPIMAWYAVAAAVPRLLGLSG